MDSDPPPPPTQTSITLKINGEWLCMIKIFMEGVVDGEGVAVKDASIGVVEGVHEGISPETSQNRGWVKANLFVGGEGVLKVSPPLPPPRKF